MKHPNKTGRRSALVVGSTGFIGTELTKQLLEKGYDVVASVRDPSSRSSEFLRQLADCLPGNLQLFKADVMEPGAFDSIVREVDFVFHAASPCSLIPLPDPQKDMIDVAVIGTENLLKSVSCLNGDKPRIILTSGIVAALPPSQFGNGLGRALTTEDWNESSTIENREAYPLSKVLQERKAWQMAESGNLDLISILPALTFGPFLSPVEDSSSLAIFKFLFKMPRCPVFNTCDIRDVCKALILAAEAPHAHGRYFLTFGSLDAAEASLEGMKQSFPEHGSITIDNRSTLIDASRTVEHLGMDTMDPQAVWADSLRTAIKLGLIDTSPSKPSGIQHSPKS